MRGTMGVLTSQNVIEPPSRPKGFNPITKLITYNSEKESKFFKSLFHRVNLPLPSPSTNTEVIEYPTVPLTFPLVDDPLHP